MASFTGPVYRTDDTNQVRYTYNIIVSIIGLCAYRVSGYLIDYNIILYLCLWIHIGNIISNQIAAQPPHGHVR